jgi:hypothetical protein
MWIGPLIIVVVAPCTAEWSMPTAMTLTPNQPCTDVRFALVFPLKTNEHALFSLQLNIIIFLVLFLDVVLKILPR